MEPTTVAIVTGAVITQEKSTKIDDNARIARDKVVSRIMQCVFVLVPFVAALDKFFNLMTYWERYVSPLVLQVLPFPAHQIMVASGPVEMLIGILVAVKPRLGALALAAMLFGIMLNLLTMPDQLHIAFLDLSLAVLALSFFLFSRDVV